MPNYRWHSAFFENVSKTIPNKFNYTNSIIEIL